MSSQERCGPLGNPARALLLRQVLDTAHDRPAHAEWVADAGVAVTRHKRCGFFSDRRSARHGVPDDSVDVGNVEPQREAHLVSVRGWHQLRFAAGSPQLQVPAPKVEVSMDDDTAHFCDIDDARPEHLSVEADRVRGLGQRNEGSQRGSAMWPTVRRECAGDAPARRSNVCHAFTVGTPALPRLGNARHDGRAYPEAMMDPTRGVLFPSRLPAFHRFAPPHGAAELVQWFWIPEWDLEPGVVSRHVVISYPALNLVVEPHGVSLVGATTGVGEREVHGRSWAVGALLKPAAVPTLTSDARSLVDTAVPFDAIDLHGHVVAAMEGRRNRLENAVGVFGRWLSVRAGVVPPAARHANALVEVLMGDDGANTPAEAAARLTVSTRTLERMTHRYIGIPPAAIIRRRRLQVAAQRIREKPELPLAAIAADLGYADHAHLTAEFRSVLGFKPSVYREESSCAPAGDSPRATYRPHG